MSYSNAQRVVLASDMHGNVSHYRTLLTMVKEQNIPYVFLGGDLTPKNGGLWTPDNKTRTIQAQATFISDFLLPYLKELSQYAYVIGIFGNDDFKSNYHLVEDIGDRITFLDNKVIPLPGSNGSLYVAGYPYVKLTPFLQKDWDRWDTDEDIEKTSKRPSKAVMTKGYISRGGKHLPVDYFAAELRSQTMTNDLAKLTVESPPTKTIYIMHDAPFDTPLDMVVPNNPYIESSQHIGSRAIRSFIEEYQPLLTLHGHIHETYAVSGSFAWQHKNTWALTPSHDFTQNPFACILFDLDNLEAAQRIII